MDLGKRIAEFRKTHKLSLVKASKEIGISESYLSNIETGKRQPKKLTTLKKIASFLKLDVRDII